MSYLNGEQLFYWNDTEKDFTDVQEEPSWCPMSGCDCRRDCMWWVRTYYEKDDCVIGECSVATIGQLLHLKDKTRHYYEGDATAAVMAGLDIE